MPKITPTKCHDGKRHAWRTVSFEEDFGNTRYFCSCTKCGSLTEFFKEKGKPKSRCLEEYDKLYIKIPSYFTS